MNTVTPFPTLTPFPTPAGTPMVGLAPAMDVLQAQALGPNVIQWWQMGVAPHWGAISLGFEILLVAGIFFAFYYRFRSEN